MGKSGHDRRGASGRVARAAAALAAAATLTAGLAGCGGRSANPVETRSGLDARLSCAHLGAEKTANLRRVEDLQEERDDNRVRSLTRVPGAIIGNPISAIVLADPSLAIYEEIGAIERRNLRIDQLMEEKGCGGEPVDSRSAAVAPLDPIDPDLYTALYENTDEPTEDALAAPQPAVAPTVVDTPEAEVVAEPLIAAERRDEASAAALAEEGGDPAISGQ